MTIAYWCVLIAAVLPYVWTGVAKSRADYNNRAPREFLERQRGFRQRANWTQQNSFEAFPAFAAAVIIAHLTGAPQDTIDILAMAFVALRLLYGLAYVADQHLLRSLLWLGGVICVVWLFVAGA